MRDARAWVTAPVIECSGAICGPHSQGGFEDAMLWRNTLLAVSIAAGIACTHTAPSPIVINPDRPTPPKGIRLAVLPVESDGFPEVAEWLSNLLADVRVSDVDEYFKPH